MKLQLISDLHTEFHDSPASFLDSLDIESNLDFLVVAGDTVAVNRQHEQDILSSFHRFSKYARHVLWIPGNHEYYGSYNSSDTNKQLAAYIVRYPNIHWLQNNELILDGSHFYGGAMWFPNVDGLNQLYERELSDFSQIKDLLQWVYHENIAFRYHANKLVTEKTIVISHHLPSRQSVPTEFRGLQSNRFFVSDEERFIAERQPRLWFHGHTHKACDYQLGNTRVVCNPHGYPSERGPVPYPKIVLEI